MDGFSIFLGFMAVVFVIAIVRALVLYVIIPALPYVGGAIGIIGAVIALYEYGKAFFNDLHPYDYYVDNDPNKQPARRSYFFGPGMSQLKKTIEDAFGGIDAQRERLWRLVTDRIEVWQKIVVGLFIIPAIIAMVVAGGAFTVVLSCVHIAFLLVVMTVIYVLFGITWIIDRLYLRIKGISIACPVCKRRYLMPTFICPNCGAEHTHLVPGKYGIWHRTCECGHVLPTTFFNGRSTLDAICPYDDCKSPLASSSARQIGIQLVGGSSSGKTVLLAAFYHEMKEKANESSVVTMRVPKYAEADFAELEEIFNGEIADPTMDVSAKMHPLLFSARAADTERQLSLYDVAGELFRDENNNRAIEEHFSYCDGIVFLIDPFSSPRYRQQVEATYGRLQNISQELTEDVVKNLSDMIHRIKRLSPNKKVNTPISVVITKADIGNVRGYVGYPKIKSEYRAHSDHYGSFVEARDRICQEFLHDIDMGFAVETIQACFSNVHYFPLSAMGHEPNGEAFDSWGVLKPFEWLIANADPAFAEAIGISTRI